MSIIVPTFNERENVERLIASIRSAFEGTDVLWEVIFVDDDSPDHTAGIVRSFAQIDNRVRCVQRIGRRGLSSAVVEGMLASSAPFLAVIDGDLQHDETRLPEMLRRLRGGQIDVVIGTRYAKDGDVGAWQRERVWISQFATWLSRSILRADLSDPMSGFFAIRREALEGSQRRLSELGFKILVDLFASSPRPLRFEELPYTFRTRVAGESKLDVQAAWEFVMLLLDKLVGHVVPVRFLAFAFVGGIGVIVHMAVLTAVMAASNGAFVLGQTIATLVAMTGNFALNNVLTYRDKRLTGWRWLRGWASFVLACSVGAVANVGIASYMFRTDIQWILAALAGILVGTVWNYAITRVYTWGAAR